MIERAAHPMVTLPTDMALEAAKEFDKLVGAIAAKRRTDAPDTFDPAAWRMVESGGWTAVGRESEGDRFDILDLAELAVVWGRYLVPGPFLTTVLAERWIGKGGRSTHGYTYSIDPHGEGLVPYGGLEGITFLTSLGDAAATSAPIAPLGVDDFAPTLPLARVASGTRCAPEVVRETLVLLMAEGIGSAEFLLKKTVDYAMIRKAYGQEIGKFQAYRHRLADMHRDIETARGLVIAAARTEGAALGAARLAAQLVRGIIEGTIHSHGAMGFTWDLGIHWYLRHAIAVEKLLRHHAAATR